MAFKVNDQVMVTDENLTGVIKKIEGNTISIETDDGFLLNFKPEELIKRHSDKSLNNHLFSNADIDSVIAQKELPKRKQPKRIPPKERFEPTMEVDLHIHQLVKSSKGMSNHDMLSLQLDTAKHKLEFAISKRIQKIVFIHGVGEGVLKIELEYLFGRYNNVKFYDANYQKYGLGATEVYIYQNVAH
jgi:hypothetical protein